MRAALLVGIAACQPPPPLPRQTQPVPDEFLAIIRLLPDKQGIILGTAIAPPSQGPALRFFQQFREADGTLLNSVELHADGCIYVAYTPLRGPRW